MDTEWTKHGFLSMNLKVGRVCPQRAASLGIRSPARWDRRALPVAAFRDAMRVFAPRILSPTLSSRGAEGEEAQAKL